MEIRKVTADKRKFLLLLLLADEEERMIDRYLDRGVKSECVVTDEGGGVLEIKNLATLPSEQGKGYASALIEFVAEKYKDRFSTLRVGTGESPATLPFYEKRGFVRVGRIPRFFADNYEKPIVDGGVLLVDMIVLERKL